MSAFKRGDRVFLISRPGERGQSPHVEGGDGDAVFEVLEVKGLYEHEIAAGKLPWVVIRGLSQPHNFEQVVHGGRLVPVEGGRS